MQQAIQKSEGLSRSTRRGWQKVGKALSIANMRAAKDQADKQRLIYQLDQSQPQKKRKRVVVDPNQRFADIEKIKAAVDQAAAEQAKLISKPTREAAIPATTAAAADTRFDSMCTQWQI